MWPAETVTVISYSLGGKNEKNLYMSNVPLQSEGQIFGCNSAAVLSDGICLWTIVRDTLFLYECTCTLFGTKSMHRTLLFWKILRRGLFMNKEGCSTWPPFFPCLDFSSHPPNSLCLLLFRGEYAECKETSQKVLINSDTDQTHNLHVSFEIKFFWIISSWDYYPSRAGSSYLCLKLKFILASIYWLYLKSIVPC